MNGKHKFNAVRVYVCPHCLFVFHEGTEATKEIEENRESFLCPECEKILAGKMTESKMLPLEFKLLDKNGATIGYGKFMERNCKDFGIAFYVCIGEWQEELKEEWDNRRNFSYFKMCQWTGYKDRNQKKIYFGDKIIYPGDNLVCTVEFSHGEILAKHPDMSPGLSPILFKSMEIVEEL